VRSASAPVGKPRRSVGGKYCEVAYPTWAYRDGYCKDLRSRTRVVHAGGNMQSEIDHYEVLQIGRNAGYRDHSSGCTGSWLPGFIRTIRGPGNTETFLLLKRAYEVLSDPGPAH